MSQLIILIWGGLCYMVGMGGLIYFMAYMGGWDFLPLHINSNLPGPLAPAIFINLGIMLLWGVQHTVMARPTFKKAWTKVIPSAAERSIYVLLSGVLMLVFCFYWQPIAGHVWAVENSLLSTLLIAIHLSGWMIAVLSSFLINHFELFGLQQVYLNFRNHPPASSKFQERFLYKIVRHPLQFGILLGMWAIPFMSNTHLMLSICMTIYIFIGLYFEEKTLSAELGESYDAYKQRVRMIVPLPK